MRNLCLAGAAAFALVAYAGCGSSDDDALTKTQFIKQGNAICKKGNKAIDQDAEKAFTRNQRPSHAEIEKFTNDTLIPEVQKQIDGLRDLNPPSADEDKVNTILDEAQAANDKAKADPTIVANNKDPFKKANQLAKDYGLTECAG